MKINFKILGKQFRLFNKIECFLLSHAFFCHVFYFTCLKKGNKSGISLFLFSANLWDPRLVNREPKVRGDKGPLSPNLGRSQAPCWRQQRRAGEGTFSFLFICIFVTDRSKTHTSISMGIRIFEEVLFLYWIRNSWKKRYKLCFI